MLQTITAVVAGLRRLIKRCEGNVAMMFGLCAIPAIIAAGMAIDVGQAYMVKVRLGAALDAAALAVGSETNQTGTQLSTALQNYFTANYPSTALGTNVTVTPVPADADLTASTVNFQAQATVPMTFMQLVGINSINVTVTAQTQKTTGLEVAVVLDNTGSMLCGPNDGAPNYSDSTCGTGVVATDTTCTNSGNGSRICTLRNAATQFVNTLTSAITSAQELYISIVPYVTTVNVGSSFCTGSTSCSHITGTGSNFTDLRGNIMPVTPITGNTTSGNSTISSISPSTSAIQAGMLIYGHGIPAGATVSTVSSSSQITISSNATLSFTGNSLAVGPTSGNTSTPYTDPTACNTSGNWNTSTPAQLTSVANTANTCVVQGMVVTSSSSGIPSATTVSNTFVNGSGMVPLSHTPTVAHSGAPITFSLSGTTTNGNATITNLKGTTASLNSIVVGMAISGTGVAANAYVASLTGSPPTSLTMSANATSTNTADIVTLTNLGATTTTGSTTVSNASFSTLPSTGQVIIGNGIPANTTITAVTGNAAQFAAGTGALTMSQNATTPSNFSSATGTCCNTTLVAFTPLTYDSTYNTASPAGSSTTTNWGGCVVEPTSSDENSSGSGVINSSVSDPDYTEPSSWGPWYPYWWASDSSNSWTSSTIQAQSTATETQGKVVTDWLTLDGPNQGCPVPMLPLTDATTTAGQTQILNTISSMWPRDAGGTQVHIGMIWGWRALSPNGPFTANNGHPLSYSTASSTAWKKVIVLMTDGTEEWPSTDNLTGLGQITDGKIGTTSNTTAVSNLNTRLADVCSNLASNGNYIVYTIGLGSDGANNTQLQNCATTSNGGFFEAATTSSLQTVFNNIAKSLIALRLTQ
jgi:Flp pilus assembly protein TadG